MPSISPRVVPWPRSSGATTGTSAAASSLRNACSSRIASRDHRPGRWNFTTSRRSSSSSTSYTRFSNARSGRHRPVERSPPTSTASRTLLGVRVKKELVRSPATIGTIIPTERSGTMIYEIRTYRIAPGSLAEVEKRFGEGYEYRKKYSELTDFLHTEIGPLNEIVHIWPYRDLAERARIRGEASKDPNWPPKISEFVRAMKSQILVPFSFLPDVRPGKVGPVFELRYYTLKPGTLPDTAKRWEAKVPERTKLSPLVVAGGVEFGQANGFIHILAYASMDQRMKIRDEARQKGVWPPPGGADRLLTQENKILLPASFSPLQ